MSDSTLASKHLVDRSRVFIDNNTRKWLVLHKTGGTPDLLSLYNWFATGAPMVSTHYGVGQDGEIWQFVLEQDGAGGNCCLETGHADFLPTNINLNWLTISIEHIDPSLDNSTPLTIAQKHASFALIKDICSRNGIPMRAGDGNGGIIGHYQLDPLSRARCPGNYPWPELFAFLQQGKVNISMEQSAKDCWQSTAHLFGGTPPSYTSGIAKAWQQLYSAGKKPGPPITAEYGSVDWSGKAIRVQEFTNTRCEWDGQAHWFPSL